MVRPLVACGILFLVPSAAFAAEREVDFESEVAPILTQQCVDCHGPNLQMAELRLDRRQFVLGDDVNPDLIKAGKSAESLLIQRLVDAKLGILMPPSFPFFPGEKAGLAESQIATLKAWIDQGAKWPDDVVLSRETAAGQGGGGALFAAIRRGDLPQLTRIPGVGKKTAERIVVELRDKLAAMTPHEEHEKPASRSQLEADVLSALENLGYDRRSAERAVEAARKGGAGKHFEDLLKESLQQLSGTAKKS